MRVYGGEPAGLSLTVKSREKFFLKRAQSFQPAFPAVLNAFQKLLTESMPP